MTDQIFISYRRDDAAYVTGHINDLLRKEFGDEAVFTDVDNIALGVDFRAVLDQTVSECQVLLAVIGAEWLTVSDQEGRARLENPADFVRIEIESALKRNIRAGDHPADGDRAVAFVMAHQQPAAFIRIFRRPVIGDLAQLFRG